MELGAIFDNQGLNEERVNQARQHFFEFELWCTAVHDLHIISAIKLPDWAVIDYGKLCCQFSYVVGI